MNGSSTVFDNLEIRAKTAPSDPSLDRISIRDYIKEVEIGACLLYTSPSPRDRTRSRMPSSA